MAIVASYDWDTNTYTQHEDLARTAWREAVAEVAAKAKDVLPECSGRVDSAVKIVLSGDVELLPEGQAKVASQSNGATKYFVVNGECECPDYAKAPSRWCKHRLAAGLHRRALALVKRKVDLATNGQAEAPSAAPPVTPPAPLPEAPVSITLKAVLHGREVLVTLRGTDFASVKAQVEDASQWLQAQSGLPATDTPQCSRHGVPLTRQHGKDGSSWWSHRLADGGWCKGK